LARLRMSRKSLPVGLWTQDLYSAGLVETGTTGVAVANAVANVEAKVARSVDGVAVIHERFRQRLIDQLRVPDSQVRVIRNWSHFDAVPEINREAVRSKLGWSPKEIVALHAGNMGAKQGLENVVESARLADTRQVPVRFVLLGGGNQRSNLERLGRGIDRLDILSSLPGREFQEALGAADVLLVNERPGLTEMSVPSKLTSYFASGNPVIAASEADSVTAAEVAASGAGLRVPPGEPEALLQAVQRLGEDKVASAALGQAGVRYRRDVLAEDAAIRSFEDWLGELIARRSTREERK
jgi:colanic acid biosynthesis glycosyl transferase WcaI